MLRNLVAAAADVPSGVAAAASRWAAVMKPLRTISPSTQLRRSSARCGRADRIVIGRRLGQHGEIGGFGERELGRRPCRNRRGRRLHAIGVPAEEDLVEVELEDLLLARAPIRAGGEERLADLAGDRIARC